MRKLHLTFDKNHSCLMQNFGLLLMIILHVINANNSPHSVIDSIIHDYSNLCVCFFSFVSGYGMFYKFDKCSLSLNGNIKKFLRLYFRYLLILFLFLPIYYHSDKWNVVTFIKHIFLISHSYNPIYWYLKFYLFVSLLSVWVAKFPLKYAILICIFSLYASIVFSQKGFPGPLFVYSYQFAVFMYGGIHYLLLRKYYSVNISVFVISIFILIVFGLLKPNIWQLDIYKFVITVMILSVLPVPNKFSLSEFNREHNANIWLIHGNVLAALLYFVAPKHEYIFSVVVFVLSYICSIFINELIKN